MKPPYTLREVLCALAIAAVVASPLALYFWRMTP
jgi:prepilin-type N-terminal cleavage/methylation domain-containing protein